MLYEMSTNDEALMIRVEDALHDHLGDSASRGVFSEAT